MLDWSWLVEIAFMRSSKKNLIRETKFFELFSGIRGIFTSDLCDSARKLVKVQRDGWFSAFRSAITSPPIFSLRGRSAPAPAWRVDSLGFHESWPVVSASLRFFIRI